MVVEAAKKTVELAQPAIEAAAPAISVSRPESSSYPVPRKRSWHVRAVIWGRCHFLKSAAYPFPAFWQRT